MVARTSEPVIPATSIVVVLLLCADYAFAIVECHGFCDEEGLVSLLVLVKELGLCCHSKNLL